MKQSTRYSSFLQKQTLKKKVKRSRVKISIVRTKYLIKLSTKMVL